VRVGGDVNVLEDLLFVPYVVTSGDYLSAEVEELFSDGRRQAEPTGGVFAIDDEEIDGVGLQQVGQVLVHNVPAGGPKYVAYKQNLHCMSLYGSLIRTGYIQRSETPFAAFYAKKGQ
jgi:hypothetical protein